MYCFVASTNTTKDKKRGGFKMAKNNKRSMKKQQAAQPDSQQNQNAPGYGDKKLTGPNRPAE